MVLLYVIIILILVVSLPLVSGLTERGGGWSLPIIPVQSIVHRVLTPMVDGNRNATSQPTPLPLKVEVMRLRLLSLLRYQRMLNYHLLLHFHPLIDKSRMCSPKTKYLIARPN
jgi:hypothetical protein